MCINCRRDNKKLSVIGAIAAVVAILGVVAVVYAYFKKKTDEISDKLDFDGELYYEDDDYFDASSQDASKAPSANGNEAADDDEAQARKLADTLADADAEDESADEEDEGKE